MPLVRCSAACRHILRTGEATVAFRPLTHASLEKQQAAGLPMSDSYADFFRTAYGRDDLNPFPYQTKLAQQDSWPDLLQAPTGLGKTASVSLAWLFRRGWRAGGRTGPVDAVTPRRLIWCLPMRVLVEQTESTLRDWLHRLNILGPPGVGRVSLHRLMGGESDLRTWADYPDEDMILIGTQDMLLSRALMRGYGMSRYQWPVHFALLHNDCIWAFDEVQLMGAGLTTSAQLEAFRRRFPLGSGSRSLWLSATLNPEWLKTVDLTPFLADVQSLGLADTDREIARDRLHARKQLQPAETKLTADNAKKGAADYLDLLVAEVLHAHQSNQQTLVILNRVDRAQGLFQRLRQRRPDAADLLIHARFRPAERRGIERALRSDASADRIVVATQAIEAGVDISSQVLFTELAPWSSLVQRFGRCNRYGEHKADHCGQVRWIDLEDDSDLLPYEAIQLSNARARLAALTDVGPATLPSTDEPRPLTAVLRRKDLLDLFNTDPDLSGFDVDIADYIRDTDQPGLQVFWREIGKEGPNDPVPQPPPARDELCPISLGQAQALRKRDAWRWDSLTGRWMVLEGAPRPGLTVMLDASGGGYDSAIGFDASSKAVVDLVAAATAELTETYGEDWRSRTLLAVGLAEHLGHVANEAEALCSAVSESVYRDAVIRAARWHDIGKAHEVFDASMHRCPEAPPGFLAKTNCRGTLRHQRPLFRHELASALGWLAQHDGEDHADLIAYLVAAHHGKVRMSLRALPTEPAAPDGRRYARGVWEGDVLPAVAFDGEHSAAVELRLALMELGDGEQGRSWTARVVELLEQHGPFRLAWLESLVRIADWRASAAEQSPVSSASSSPTLRQGPQGSSA